MADIETIVNSFKRIQDQIVKVLHQVDNEAEVKEDLWERKGGGGGRTRIIRNGKIIEKGGINFSEVFGEIPPTLRGEFNIDKGNFFATGVSVIIHPVNPHVPIIHMNVRYFELNNGTYWFGGGIDLTPHYIVKNDARYFHLELKKVCDKYNVSLYPRFKQWADDYFFIPHRNETRGIGGIFFDKLMQNEAMSKAQCFDFVTDIGSTFAPLYITLIERNQQKPYNKNEKEWQNIRSGRYVEFNLLYDRGTKFGLQTDGRIESILLSLPQTATWEYDYKISEGSIEFETQQMLRKGINWVEDIW